jgi:ABC-2 type transport system permease protein
MKAIIDLARMELQKMFYSPIAWFVLIVFAVQAGIQLMQQVSHTVMNSALGHATQALTSAIFTSSGGIFNRIQGNLYLYIPLLTMGLLSREFSSGSIKLLYSSPISNKQIVLGKFVSMMIFGLAMTFILFLTAIFGSFIIKDFDFPLVLTALLGLYLVICAYSAIGLFMSSLTSYQIVAAIGTFTTLFVLGQVGRMWQSIEFVRDITYWLSIDGRSDTFIAGLICSEDLLYFILVSGLFIAFTIFRLKGIREKSPRYISFTRYAGAFLVVSLIGYISTIPAFMKYHDSTYTNTNTLTENSQEVISKLKGKLKITAYVNIFDQNYIIGKPTSQKFYMSIFEQYSRFYPNMKLKFKYYYDAPMEEIALKNHNITYKGLTDKEALEKVCNIYEVNSKLFRPGKDFLGEIDLKSELNRFVNKLSTEDGKASYLRFFNDPRRLPDESQITAAFKKLIMELPMVGFVKGHEERDVNDFGSRGYFSLAKEKPFRYALINNGFDFTECELSGPVDKNIDILIIAEAKTMFSAQEIKNLNDYIDRGGNLIIACDTRRQDNMNPIVERLGVKFLPGQVVEKNKGYDMDLVSSLFTEEGEKIVYQFEFISQNGECVTMPGAVAISYKNKGEFKYIPLLVSDTVKNIAQLDSLGSWNELKTTDFVDDIARYNPEDGETLGPLTTALALTRKVAKKEQRIVILGDADCFSNGESSRQRTGIRANNFIMAHGMFFWLSDNEVPVDIRRPNPPDDKIYLKKSDMPFFNALYKIIIPVLITLAFLLIWLRRKGR